MDNTTNKTINNEETLSKIEEAAKSFDETKERVMTRISSSIRIAIDRLKEAEVELLKEAEDVFGENPFLELYGAINSGANPPEEEIQGALGMKVPQDFGPSEESLSILLGEIDSFKAWKNKENPSVLELLPKNIRCDDSTYNQIVVEWDKVGRDCIYEISLNGYGSEDVKRSLEPYYTIPKPRPGWDYNIRVRSIAIQNGAQSPWSEPILVPAEVYFTWKRCPAYAEYERGYCLDPMDSNIATNIRGSNCALVGNATLLPGTVTRWSIKLKNSRNGTGLGIFIGVAPISIYHGDYGIDSGWYLNCYKSTLRSGPPHNYKNVTYGERKGNGNYICSGDSVGVAMNTSIGELSFVLNGVDLGVAYEGIPLDKPLVPCVILGYRGDSVEITLAKKKGRRRYW